MSFSVFPDSKLYLFASAIMLGAFCGGAQAQGFDCRYAHYADEAAICQDRTLGRLDDQLTHTFNQTMRRLPDQEQRRLDREEDSWVLERRRCGADPNCIARAYQSRMQQLERLGAGEQQRPAGLPPGFPPAPPFFGGGAPYASGTAVPPPPPFVDLRQGAPRRGAPSRTIEGSQSGPIIERREDRAPQIEQRQSNRAVEQEDQPQQSAGRQSTEVIEQPNAQAAPSDRTQTRQTIDRGAQQAPQLGRAQSTATTEQRDRGGRAGETPAETSTNAPGRSTAANENALGGERTPAPQQQPLSPDSAAPTHAKSSRHSEGKAKTHATKEQPKAATETANASESDSPDAPAARPVPPPATAKQLPHQETHAAATAAAPPPSPPFSGSSTSDSRKPVIRWVDPPPSK